jgi:hypothetical protein
MRWLTKPKILTLKDLISEEREAPRDCWILGYFWNSLAGAQRSNIIDNSLVLLSHFLVRKFSRVIIIIIIIEFLSLLLFSLNIYNLHFSIYNRNLHLH